MGNLRKNAVFAFVVLMAGALVSWAIWDRSGRRTVDEQATPSSDHEPPLDEFTLIDRTGESFRSADHLGRVWVASFFFTQCGGNCRMLNMQISRLAREFGRRGVEFVSITCDPTNDTPAELRSYAKLFRADPTHWRFLTGELDYIQRIGHDIFSVAVTERSHSTQLLVIDQKGLVRGTYDSAVPEQLEKTRQLIEELLEEGGGGRIE